MPALRADEQAKAAALDVAISNYRRALNGDESPSPAELQLMAAVQPLLGALESFYSYVNNRKMWIDARTDLLQTGARFDEELRTPAKLQEFITSIERDQAKWTATYGSFEAVYSRLLQLEDQLSTARAQRGVVDVKAFRLARQNAELAFETAKSKRRDTEYQIETLEASLLKITALQRAAKNCPPADRAPVAPPPVQPAQTTQLYNVNITARGRCGRLKNFATNEYSNQTFGLRLPDNGAGPITGNFTRNPADPDSRPIAPGPQNLITGSTNGTTASGTWNLSGVTGTWYGETRKNPSGEWETNGTLCNRVNESVGCVFRWSVPQIAPPMVTLADLRRCLN